MRSVWCFFFSSRRRHTRCSRDWSSDVCSSDLGRFSTARLPFLGLTTRAPSITFHLSGTSLPLKRSEERRVGKECRSRWWWYDDRKRGRGPGGEVTECLLECMEIQQDPIFHR